MKNDRYLKSYFYDTNIPFLLFLLGVIQFATCVKINCNWKILIIEEIIFGVCIILSFLKANKYNAIAKKGRLIKARYDKEKSYYTSYLFKGVVRYKLHLFCVAKGITYVQELEIENGTDEYKKKLDELFVQYDIPVIVCDTGKYVVLVEDLIRKYLLDDDVGRRKSKALLFVVARYILLLGCMIWTM